MLDSIFFVSALKVEKTIKTRNGMHIKFIVFQLVKLNNIPADKLANAIVENTIKSLIPCTLNFLLLYKLKQLS